MQVTPQHGGEQTLQDVLFQVQELRNYHVRECEYLRATIEDQADQAEKLRATIDDQAKYFRDRILELQIELEGYNCTCSVSSRHLSCLT